MSTVYQIDNDDRILSWNRGWSEFAAENNGAELADNGVVGKELWTYISDPSTRFIYQQIVSKVRDDHEIKFSFRCDAPDLKRGMEMRVLHVGGGTVEFQVSTLWTEPREFQPIMDKSTPRSEKQLYSCSWCNRLRHGVDEWLEIEDALSRIPILDGKLPKLSHGICEACYDSRTRHLSSVHGWIVNSSVPGTGKRNERDA